METTTQKIIKLVGETAAMRTHQKNFFKEKENARLRAHHFKAARESERIVDQLIKEITEELENKSDNQINLFV